MRDSQPFSPRKSYITLIAGESLEVGEAARIGDDGKVYRSLKGQPCHGVVKYKQSAMMHHLEDSVCITRPVVVIDFTAYKSKLAERGLRW